MSLILLYANILCWWRRVLSRRASKCSARSMSHSTIDINNTEFSSSTTSTILMQVQMSDVARLATPLPFEPLLWSFRVSIFSDPIRLLSSMFLGWSYPITQSTPLFLSNCSYRRSFISNSLNTFFILFHYVLSRWLSPFYSMSTFRKPPVFLCPLFSWLKSMHSTVPQCRIITFFIFLFSRPLGSCLLWGVSGTGKMRAKKDESVSNSSCAQKGCGRQFQAEEPTYRQK